MYTKQIYYNVVFRERQEMSIGLDVSVKWILRNRARELDAKKGGNYNFEGRIYFVRGVKTYKYKTKNGQKGRIH